MLNNLLAEKLIGVAENKNRIHRPEYLFKVRIYSRRFVAVFRKNRKFELSKSSVNVISNKSKALCQLS